MFKGPNEDFLGDILCISLIAHHFPGEVVHPRAVQLENRTKSGDVAASEPGQGAGIGFTWEGIRHFQVSSLVDQRSASILLLDF